MEKKSRDLFAFDLDGTLVHSLEDGKRGVPDFLKEALVALSSAATIVVATGRRYKAARVDLQSLPSMPYRIVHNGLVIKDQREKTVVTSQLPLQQVIQVAQQIEAHGFPAFLVSDGWDYGVDFMYRAQALQDHENLQYLHRRPNQENRLLNCFDDLAQAEVHPFLEIATVGDFKSLEALRKELTSTLPANLQAVLVKNVGYAPISALEIFDKNFSKWTAVQYVKQDLGLERVFGVGDDGNDLELIREADFGVAMSHADPHILEVSDRQAKGPEGLAEFIWDYLKHEAR